MSNDIATISLRVNTGGLIQGNQELDKFADKAGQAALSADKLSDSQKESYKAFMDTARSVSETHRRVNEARAKFLETERSQRKLTKSTEEQTKELQALLNKISPVNKALDELDTIQESLSKFRGKGMVSDESFTRYNSVLETTRAKLAQVMESETAEGRARLEQAQAAQRAAASAKTFISSLEEQTAAIGKTRAELLELKAAQLGVSGQAAPMIAKLKEQENAWKNGAISAGQYRNAMRYLPMQMTDIVTSLASGMPVYMVAIQQGGQLRDSFGGVGNAMKAMLSMVTPARLAIGGMVGVAGLLATAWYKGSQEATEFNKQLILTGDYAGKTSAQLTALAKSISGGGVTQYAASSVLSQVVGSGRFDASKLETVTRAAVAMEQATGQAVDTTIANFQKLYSDPTKASEELNSQLHYLTAAQFEYISSLERRGDKEAAGQAAADAYSEAEQRRSKQILDNLGLVERAALSARNAFKGMWDELLNIGRPEAPKDMLASMENQLAIMEKNLKPERKRMGYGYSYDTSAQDQEYDNQRKAQLAKIALLKSQINPMRQAINLQGDLNGAISASKVVNEEAISAQKVINKYLDAGTTAAEKRSKAQAEYTQAIKDNAAAAKAGTATLWSSEEIAKGWAGIEKLYADPKTPKGAGGQKVRAYTDDSATRMLQDSGKRLASLQAQFGVTSQMTAEEKRLVEFNQQIADLKEKRILTADDKSVLARSGEIKAALEIEASESRRLKQALEIAKLHEQAVKYSQQIDARASALLDSAGLSDRESSRNREREQLKLANFSPEDYDAASVKLEDYYSKEDALRGDWLAGSKKGWMEFEDSATNVYAQMQNISQSAFTGMASTLTDYFTTGKASFTEFLTTFLKGTAQMLTQLALVNGMKSAFGGTAVGNFFGIQAWSGGYIPEFDVGGYTGDGGKYQPKGVVHGGEFVFTKEATSALGIGNLYALMRGAQGYANGGYVGTAPMYGLQSAGAGNVTVQTSVTVQNQNSQQQSTAGSDAMSRAYKQTIDQSVREGISKQLRPGGLIWNATKSR